MKVLYIAFECSPVRGSECAIGWNWPYYMRKYHDVTVLTRLEHKEEIQDYLRDNNINDMNFIYMDVPNWMNIYRNTRRYWLLYYQIWQRYVRRKIKKLQEQQQFEIIHHITMNEFRTIESARNLHTNYIFGPTGGAQLTPEYLKSYTKGHEKEEKIREYINRWIRHSKNYQKQINASSYIFFANMETKEYLEPIIKDKSICKIMLDTGLCSELLTEPEPKQVKKEFVFLWAGRLVYRKGINIVLDAMRLLPKNLNYQFLICGGGPELTKLQSMACEYEISDHVKFCGNIDYKKMKEMYQISDAFLFPSLRETSGTVVLEAMSNGVPVIGFNNGGIKTIMSEREGYYISGNSKSSVIDSLSQIMLHCINNPDEVQKKGRAAFEYVKNNLTWEIKTKEMNEFYKELERG